MVLEKTLESLLDCKEIIPVNLKGNQPWIFIGGTDPEAEAPILWPPDTKNRLIGKDPDVGRGFPDSSVGKESACNAGDHGSIPGSERSTEKGIGYPLQYSSASLVAQLVTNLPAVEETWVQSLAWEDPVEKGKATHSSILAWRIPWTVTVPAVTKSQADWLSLSLFFHFGVVFSGFILFGTLYASWNWMSIFFSTLGKFSAVISSNIFFASFSISCSFWDLYKENIRTLDAGRDIS